MAYTHREYREDGTYWVSAEWNDTTRTVTTYNEAGVVTDTRPYTAAENLAVDESIKADAVATNESDLITKATQAIANNVAYLNRASTTTAQDKAQIKAL